MNLNTLGVMARNQYLADAACRFACWNFHEGSGLNVNAIPDVGNLTIPQLSMGTVAEGAWGTSGWLTVSSSGAGTNVIKDVTNNAVLASLCRLDDLANGGAFFVAMNLQENAFPSSQESQLAFGETGVGNGGAFRIYQSSAAMTFSITDRANVTTNVSSNNATLMANLNDGTDHTILHVLDFNQLLALCYVNTPVGGSPISSDSMGALDLTKLPKVPTIAGRGLTILGNNHTGTVTQVCGSSSSRTFRMHRLLIGKTLGSIAPYVSDLAAQLHANKRDLPRVLLNLPY